MSQPVVDRHTVEQPHHNPADIPAENVERGDDELSVFEWYCPDCEEWLGWPDNAGQPARLCEDAADCSHADEDDAACGHVVCAHCGALADSHEWVLEGEQAGMVARQIFDDGPDPETAIRQALLEDLQRVTQGADVKDIVEERRDLFEEYTQRVDGDGDDGSGEGDRQ
jgi:hypothetical protein